MTESVGARFVGRMGDFDSLVGSWTVKKRTLRERLEGSDDWEEFDSRFEASRVWPGGLLVEGDARGGARARQ